jgi:polyhydroxyalkanoate synthesis repressor PhaR
MADRVVIKKYANRRLYDTNQSVYVTLSQVADIIKQGTRVEVVDAKTKEDVTAFILTQIILEEARKEKVLLPVPLLHLLIQYGDNLLGEFFDKYLQQTIQSYLAYKADFEEQFKKWLDLGVDVSEMSQKSLKELAPFKPFINMLSRSETEEDPRK